MDASFDASGYLLTPANGPQLWFLDTRMSVKAGAAQTGGGFTLIEWSAPPGFGPPRHQHDREDEAFYLLAGDITVDCGDQCWDGWPRRLRVPAPRYPAFLHGRRRPGTRAADHHPAGFEDFAAELGRPAEHSGLPEPSAPDIPRLIEASGRYGQRVSARLGPPARPPFLPTARVPDRPRELHRYPASRRP